VTREADGSHGASAAVVSRSNWLVEMARFDQGQPFFRHVLAERRRLDVPRSWRGFAAAKYAASATPVAEIRCDHGGRAGMAVGQSMGRAAAFGGTGRVRLDPCGRANA